MHVYVLAQTFPEPAAEHLVSELFYQGLSQGISPKDSFGTAGAPGLNHFPSFVHD